MDENPDKLEEYMEGMVDLHLLIHKQACPLLNKLKEKTIRALKSVEQLDDSTRYELMTRLDGMPKHTKLCHGDFNPTNIIVGDDGNGMSLTGYMLPREMPAPMWREPTFC